MTTNVKVVLRRASATAEAFVSLVLLPAGAALASLRWLIPSGGTRGAGTLAARLGAEHPLAVGLVLFVLFGTVATYWRRRLRARFVDAGMHEPSRVAKPPAAIPRAALGLVALALLILATRTSAVEVYRVTSGSMAPTLNVGDRLLVDKRAYGWRLPFSARRWRPTLPARGDLVVFRSDEPGGAAVLVKRVLGLPGDVISFREGAPTINGWQVPTCDAGPFLTTDAGTFHRGRLAVEIVAERAYLIVKTPGDNDAFISFVVPPDQVFVLGDQRGISRDSRAWNDGRGGGLAIERIIGRVKRLAVGGFRDGRFDAGSVLAPLGPRVREPNLDLATVDARIATCLAHRPRTTLPPLAARQTE